MREQRIRGEIGFGETERKLGNILKNLQTRNIWRFYV